MSSILSRATEEARQLQESWVGPDHVVLAVLAEPGRVSSALADLGLTYDRVRLFLTGRRSDPPVPPLKPGEYPRSNPAMYRVMGWATGFAAAHNRRPDDADWLLGCLHLENGVGSLAHELGTSSQAITDALARHGITVPPLKPPVYKPWRGHRRVVMPEHELESVLQILGKRHPPGSEWRWGFNYTQDTPRQARVDAEEGIDLDSIVAEARP